MRIDPETLLFEDLTSAEVKVLRGALENIVLKGDPLVADWFEKWLAVARASSLQTTQRLLLLSVVLPGRLGISLLRHRDELKRKKYPPTIQMAFPKGANVRFLLDLAYGKHENHSGCRVTWSGDPLELHPIVVEDSRKNCYSGGQYWRGWAIPKGTVGTVDRAGICDPQPTPFVYVELVPGKTVLVTGPYERLAVVGALGVTSSEKTHVDESP